MSNERAPMSRDRDERGERFLTRWSRVKAESRAEVSATPAAAQVPAASPAPGTDDAPPELPSIEKLTLNSDFSGFFHPKVDEDLRRRALRKLFSDPHFNVMDGLDVYIDDYSKTEPIPATMLASLTQAQRIFEWAAEKKDDARPEAANASQSASDAQHDSASVGETEEPGGHSESPARAEPPSDESIGDSGGVSPAMSGSGRS
jgi:hypothetical protein